MGHLDDHWSDRLGGFSINRDPDGTTTLTGTAVDQAQLHGVLAGLRDVGVDLLALHTIERAESSDRVAPHEGTPPVLSALNRPLRTRRLALRSATCDDAEATWVYRQLADVNEWLTGAPDTFDAYLRKFTDASRLATTVVVERHDGTVIGDFMLRRRDARAQIDVLAAAVGQEVELGWVLDPAHTGRGCATEAVDELLRYSFEELGVHRVVASCFASNHASWRFMERLGMRRESHTRDDALHRSGEWLDSFSYALLSGEWAARTGVLTRNPQSSFNTR